MPADGLHRFVLAWGADAATLALPAVDLAAGSGDVAAALALAPALPALHALESWLGVHVDRIAPAQGARVRARSGTRRLIVGLPALDRDAAVATLDLPLAALPFGRPLPTGLVLRWPDWRSRVIVQRLPDDALPLRALAPGALVLLPDAFGALAPWALRLCIGSGVDVAPEGDRSPPVHWPELEVPGWLPGCPASDLGSAVPRAAESDATGWRVELDLPVTLSAGAWFGAGGVCRWPPLPATLWQGAQPHALGEFVPAGRGWALRLTHLAAQRRLVPG